MSDGSKIEWTEATWSWVTGCTKISDGCLNCYIQTTPPFRIEHRKFSGPDIGASTGLKLYSDRLWWPRRWRKPRRVFVNSLGDTFHEDVPRDLIAEAFAVMAVCPQHTFQVLTKRARRMREVMDGPKRHVLWSPKLWHRSVLPNVWLGVSVEDQARADERIPDLLAMPAAQRFISAEPLLGPIDLTAVLHPLTRETGDDGLGAPLLDWVIVGGESGPNARPMHPDWARSLREQCTAAGVPFFFKQWGEWLPTSSLDIYCHGASGKERKYPQAAGLSMLADGRICLQDFSVAEHQRRIKTGVARNSRAIEVNQQAIDDHRAAVEDGARKLDNPLGYQWLYRVGKKAAGALLDGREWREMPA